MGGSSSKDRRAVRSGGERLTIGGLGGVVRTPCPLETILGGEGGQNAKEGSTEKDDFTTIQIQMSSGLGTH